MHDNAIYKQKDELYPQYIDIGATLRNSEKERFQIKTRTNFFVTSNLFSQRLISHHLWIDNWNQIFAESFRAYGHATTVEIVSLIASMKNEQSNGFQRTENES